jgi:hypothetical protein
MTERPVPAFAGGAFFWAWAFITYHWTKTYHLLLDKAEGDFL